MYRHWYSGAKFKSSAASYTDTTTQGGNYANKKGETGRREGIEDEGIWGEIRSKWVREEGGEVRGVE